MEHVKREIEELHTFFEEWFTGRLPEREDAFARVRDVLDERFILISPSGSLDQRPALIRTIRRAWGRRADDGMRIWIEGVRVRHTVGDLLIATYEEWQQIGAKAPGGRLSTVVFRTAPDTPNGLMWLHLHETVVPAKRH